MKVEFYKHNIEPADKAEVMNVLDSLFLTTGAQVGQFEKKFAAYLNARYAVGLTSCTEALFLCLKYLEVQEGDEVIIPAMTFLATANVIEYCGATPVLVDVDSDTGLINLQAVKNSITDRTKCVIPVHLYGQMVDMMALHELATLGNIEVIEDACHAIEAIDNEMQCGQLSLGACFSFYATKNLTCGEGGAITTNDEKFYNWLHKARLHGMSKGAADRYVSKFAHYDLEMLGYKCNMNNIQAAMLINQLDRIDGYWDVKHAIAAQYNDGFKASTKINTLFIKPNTKHAHHLYTILVHPNHRDELIIGLQDAGIGCAVNYRALPQLSYYKNKYKYQLNQFPNAERIGASTITLPFYAKLTQEEINYVIDQVLKISKNFADV